ncbi:DNA adenine methylase [Staphylococcus felis]|uniref:DNA adenine methylase n=1 Tax=Staphylococcus felis TaxID=46127 RepID=UPI0021D2A04D|nr:DNA adenine methylase [Staphylococcus felis]UXR86219.1 DNA adenine methylase [Staphylococcus felis]
MVTPLRYPGGKYKTYKLVEYLIKENNCISYAEPYAGVAVKLLLNNRVDRILLNDYDKSIYFFWKSTINYTEKFIELIEKTEVNIEIGRSIQKLLT